jgi:glutaconate CoA-transferase subunit A
MSRREAVSRFVADGDYLVYECNYLMRGPSSLLREIIRQRKRDIWLAGKFTYPGRGAARWRRAAYRRSIVASSFPRVRCSAPVRAARGLQYSNVVMTLRLQAGAMGTAVPAGAVFGGTSGFGTLAPNSSRPIHAAAFDALIPALNPEWRSSRAQADVYGNARVFGTGTAHVDAALASRK